MLENLKERNDLKTTTNNQDQPETLPGKEISLDNQFYDKEFSFMQLFSPIYQFKTKKKSDSKMKRKFKAILSKLDDTKQKSFKITTSDFKDSESESELKRRKIQQGIICMVRGKRNYQTFLKGKETDLKVSSVLTLNNGRLRRTIINKPKTEDLKKINEKQETNYPKKQSSSKGKSGKQFKMLQKFMEKLHMGKDIPKKDLVNLSEEDKSLLKLLLKKHFGEKYSDQLVNEKISLWFQNSNTQKRNEEKIKQIWKRFLRKVFDDFKKKNKKDKREKKQASIPLQPELYQDKWKRFYYFIFRELLEKSSAEYPLDLVMDICTEKTVGLVKDRNSLSSDNNWRTMTKVAAMKKVPASFRYLVLQTKSMKKRLMKFICKENSKGVMTCMMEIIKKKLEKMFKQWETGFLEEGRDFQKFYLRISNQISNPKFKLPWLLKDITEAVDYCLKDIESAKLEKEFSLIKQNHYSFVK